MQAMPKTHLPGNSPPLQVHGLKLLGVLRGEHGRPDLGVSVVGDIVPGCEPLPIFRHHLQGQRVGTQWPAHLRAGKARGGGGEALKRWHVSFLPKERRTVCKERNDTIFYSMNQDTHSMRWHFHFPSGFFLLSFIKQASDCSWANTEKWIASYWKQSLESQPIKRKKAKLYLYMNKADLWLQNKGRKTSTARNICINVSFVIKHNSETDSKLNNQMNHLFKLP